MLERNRRKLPSKIFLKTSIVITVVLVLVHLFLQYLNLIIFNENFGWIFELSNRFDLDDESSVPTWFAQILLLAVGLASALAAYLKPQSPQRIMWLVFAGLGIIMSLDEIATFHEYILQGIHVYVLGDSATSIGQNAWLLVMPIILSFAGAIVYALYKHFPRRTAWILVLGGTIFLVGAVAVDMLSSIVPAQSFLHQGVVIAVEEALELIGTSIVLYGIIDHIERYNLKELSVLLSKIANKIR